MSLIFFTLEKSQKKTEKHWEKQYKVNLQKNNFIPTSIFFVPITSVKMTWRNYGLVIFFEFSRILFFDSFRFFFHAREIFKKTEKD